MPIIASAGLAIGVLIGLLVPHGTPYKASASAPTPAPAPERRLSRFDLLAMTPDELAKVDIADMNLACAEGLPGAEGINRAAALGTLDTWAKHVKEVTERHLYRAKDPKYAEHYHHSENFLRVEILIQVLQEDCGVRYNPDRIYTPRPEDSRDHFLHGLLDPKCGGTCASMPVLYTAVGRRLGYPIKLVAAKQHLFCRWDTPTERFNIEGSSNDGWDAYDDNYYRTWPKPLSQAEIDSGDFLRSMTPMDELAEFLLCRGICEAVNHRLPAARASLAEAHRLCPQSPIHIRSLLTAMGGDSTAIPEPPLIARPGFVPGMVPNPGAPGFRR